jgi:hypothetical protein
MFVLCLEKSNFINTFAGFFKRGKIFMLENEFRYYVAHQKELVEKYKGQFIVIVGEKVVGSYQSFEEALLESQNKYEPGKFLIQECLPGEEAYTQTFHTRAIFN